METKQIMTAFAIGLLTIGVIRFIFAPHPEKAEDVIFVENIGTWNAAGPLYFQDKSSDVVFVPDEGAKQASSTVR